VDPVEKLFDFDNKSVSFEDVVRGILKASKDPKVVGLICKLGGGIHLLPLSYRTELRDAILTFGNQNKMTVCFSEDLDLPAYYLASGFKKIYLLNLSVLAISGLMSTSLFVKNMLKKLNIKVDGYQREKYKNMLNMFTEEKYTQEQKEITKQLLEGLTNGLYEDIAISRGVKLEQVAQWVDEGLFTGEDAMKSNIIDGVGTRDEIYGKLIKDCNLSQLSDASFLFLSAYSKKAGQYYPSNASKSIAVVYLNGNIMSGENKSGTAGGDAIARAIRSAANDNVIKAIVFRVETPGGSATASSVIGDAILYAKEKKKKIIVSMGSVAASGGYWVSMYADKIVANKTTITGSIGVVALKMNTREMYKEWLGVTFDETSTSKSSEMFSSLHSIEKGSHIDNKWNYFMDHFYQAFKKGVSEGRNIPIETVDQIAQGKVYTGEEALKLNLIDKIGGFHDAIELAKELVEIKKEEDVNLKIFPAPQSLLQLILSSSSPPKNSNESEQRGMAPSVFSFGIFGKTMKMMKVIGNISEPIVKTLEIAESQDNVLLSDVPIL
jgi:protease IV